MNLVSILNLCFNEKIQLAGVLTSNELKMYAKAGSVAEEALTAIRTVYAFNGNKKELER